MIKGKLLVLCWVIEVTRSNLVSRNEASIAGIVVGHGGGKITVEACAFFLLFSFGFY